MAATWRGAPPVRDITICKGEDIDIGGSFTRDGAAWIPPDDTTVYFRVFRGTAQGGTLDLPCTLTDAEFSVHIESTVCDTIKDKTSFWFYVQTPDTTDGNPKVITTGKVKRVDPS